MSTQLFPPEFFRALERINRRPVDPVGSCLSPRLGNSVQGFELRDARDGDDARRIDWRASARSKGLQVRRREDSEGGTLALALDRSKSLDPGNSRRDFDQRRLALALGWKALEGGGDVVLCVGGESPRSFGSFARRSALQGALDGLRNPSDEGQLPLDMPKPSNARLVALADPWVEDSWWELLGAWVNSGGRADVVCLVLPQEDMPPSGPLRLSDVESGERLLAHPRSSRWPIPWDEWLEAWAAKAKSSGVRPFFVRVGTDGDSAVKIIENCSGAGLV